MAQTEDFYNPDFDIIFQKLTPYFLREADIEINSLRGDFRNQDTANQDIDFILIAKKGQFFWEPLIGYDTERLQNTRIDRVAENAKLVAELRKDGFTEFSNLLIGHTTDLEFIEAIRPQDRAFLPKDSLVINVDAKRV
jgi:hypothetical protein